MVTLLAAGRPALAAEAQPIEIGIIPTLSTRTILSTYQPLRDYLAERLARPVVLVTAPDYRSFIARTQRREYRVVVTAPHFARLAQLETGYVPLVRVKRELRGIIVVRRDSGIASLADLRGKTIATPENLAIVTMLGEQLLQKAGLEPGRDVDVHHTQSFNSAMLAVHGGQASAAVTAATALKQMAPEVRESLREIAATDAVPHVMYLAHPETSAEEVRELRALLAAFETQQPAGAEFFQRTGFVGLVPPTADDLRVLDPYVSRLKRRLNAP
jgi:phosphonate transport system substrate-binding protein